MATVDNSLDSVPRWAGVDRGSILHNHSIFRDLHCEQVKRLEAGAMKQTARRGTIIFAKGDPANELFALIAGTVKIGPRLRDGRLAVFHLRHEGDIFGEIDLLDGGPRYADAEAMQDCELMTIRRFDILALINNHPRIAVKFMNLLCARFREASEHVEEVVSSSGSARLAWALLRLCRAPNYNAMAICQHEIGEMIGLSRETTNKYLRAWEKRGWLRIERTSIMVLAPHGLAKIAATTSGQNLA